MLYSALFDGAIGVGGVLESLLSLQPISNAAKIAVANMFANHDLYLICVFFSLFVRVAYFSEKKLIVT